MASARSRPSAGRGPNRGVTPAKLSDLVYGRALVIERLVRSYEGCEGADAVDLAFDELRSNPGRTNLEVARVVAGRIAQP